MKKVKTKAKKGISNPFKGFRAALSSVMAYLLLVIVALYFVTDYAMTTDSSQYIQYIHLTKETAAYVHHQLTLPFCAGLIIFILPSLMKK